MTIQAALLLTLGLSLADLMLFPVLISWLRKNRFTQLIREEGPSSHKSKAGTPTGGGLMLFANIVVTAFLYVGMAKGWSLTHLDVAGLVFVAVNLLSGLTDDWLKEIKHRNDGLLGYQKLLIQTAAAALFFCLARPNPAWSIRLASGAVLLGGWLFYGVATVYAVGMVNAFNLTDGLDGLLSKTSLPVFVVAAVSSIIHPVGLTGVLPLAALAFVIAFLWFNGTKASIFMGDTGSLALGAVFIAWAFASQNIVSSMLVGGLFLVEALSVMIQVLVFKASGRRKRVFLMAPIHHHFEKLGWDEPKIVDRFFVVSTLFVVAGALTMAWR